MSQKNLKIGTDCIGVGVGALIFNNQGKIFLAKRGPKAKNERGKWEIPGGAVEFNETLEEALKREVFEEYEIKIVIKKLLTVHDHIIADEFQHWVSPTYICEIIAGSPKIMEPEKCTQLSWYTLTEAQKLPLSIITKSDLEYLKNHS